MEDGEEVEEGGDVGVEELSESMGIGERPMRFPLMQELFRGGIGIVKKELEKVKEKLLIKEGMEKEERDIK